VTVVEQVSGELASHPARAQEGDLHGCPLFGSAPAAASSPGVRVTCSCHPTSGLKQTSYARCEDIRSVSEGRFVRRLGTVDLAVMQSRGRAVRIFLEV